MCTLTHTQHTLDTRAHTHTHTHPTCVYTRHVCTLDMCVHVYTRHTHSTHTHTHTHTCSRMEFPGGAESPGGCALRKGYHLQNRVMNRLTVAHPCAISDKHFFTRKSREKILNIHVFACTHVHTPRHFPILYRITQDHTGSHRIAQDHTFPRACAKYPFRKLHNHQGRVHHPGILSYCYYIVL